MIPLSAAYCTVRPLMCQKLLCKSMPRWGAVVATEGLAAEIENGRFIIVGKQTKRAGRGPDLANGNGAREIVGAAGAYEDCVPLAAAVLIALVNEPNGLPSEPLLLSLPPVAM